MADNKHYLAIGEEAVRSTEESSTVGYVPVESPVMPDLEFDERPRGEFRGEDSNQGDTDMIRYIRKWTTALEVPMFSEAGTVPAILGTLIKHFFGASSSAQNASTGQYYHMMYMKSDPFATANLGTKALTLNVNLNEGATMKNWPFAGGRVTGLTFAQETGQHLIMTADMMGTIRGTTTAEIGSVVLPAENLRFDFNNLTVYTGTITRTGSAPNYTDFTFGSATQIKPDSINVKITNGMEDIVRLSGLDYADKTRMGKLEVEVEMTIDWEDPASGFSSADDLNAWINGESSTNLFLYWNSSTQAGTGDMHGLYLDLPVVQRMGGKPEYDLEKDPMVTLKFKGLVDLSTTTYAIGCMLKNTASAI